MAIGDLLPVPDPSVMGQQVAMQAARPYYPDPEGVRPQDLSMTGATIPGDSPQELELMRQAYADQDSRLSSRPPLGSSGLGLADPSVSMAQAGGMSSRSGGGDESNVPNWLYGIGMALSSAAGGYRGDFSLPMQHMQLKQQAELRKQAYAQQQAQLEESKKQHAFQQVTGVLSNKDMSDTQKAELLEGFAKGENPMIARFSRTAIDGIGKKRLGRVNLYMERYPTQMQKLAEGMKDGSMTADDIDARLGLMDEVEKHNAKLTGEAALEDEIKGNPNASPGQKAWLEERQAKRLKEQTEANLKVATAPYEQQSAALKPAQQVADINRKNQESQDKTTLGREAEGLMGMPWNQMTTEQKKTVLDWHQQREVEKQEAGARAREQVKVETSLAPGVMMLDNLSKLTEKSGMFVSDSDGDWKRFKQMASSRWESWKGTDEFRQWNQMADGMRATLARMAMEVGNLAATEQDRALHLIADPFGGLHGLPDSREVARKKHALLGEFLKAGLEGSQGPDAQSRVQAKLTDILDRLDKEVPLPSIGDVTASEGQMIQQMQSQGKSKRSIQAAILKQRGGH